MVNNSNSHLPLYYRIAATWVAYGGSLLLWMLVVAHFSRTMPAEAVVRVLAVMVMIACDFLAFILLTSNPFRRTLQGIPIDGHDLNPVLQDIGLIFHPPLLYMGYVGFSVAFALLSLRWLPAGWTRPGRAGHCPGRWRTRYAV